MYNNIKDYNEIKGYKQDELKEYLDKLDLKKLSDHLSIYEVISEDKIDDKDKHKQILSLIREKKEQVIEKHIKLANYYADNSLDDIDEIIYEDNEKNYQYNLDLISNYCDDNTIMSRVKVFPPKKSAEEIMKEILELEIKNKINYLMQYLDTRYLLLIAYKKQNKIFGGMDDKIKLCEEEIENTKKNISELKNGNNVINIEIKSNEKNNDVKKEQENEKENSASENKINQNELKTQNNLENQKNDEKINEIANKIKESLNNRQVNTNQDEKNIKPDNSTSYTQSLINSFKKDNNMVQNENSISNDENNINQKENDNITSYTNSIIKSYCDENNLFYEDYEKNKMKQKKILNKNKKKNIKRKKHKKLSINEMVDCIKATVNFFKETYKKRKSIPAKVNEVQNQENVESNTNVENDNEKSAGVTK